MSNFKITIESVIEEKFKAQSASLPKLNKQQCLPLLNNHN